MKEINQNVPHVYLTEEEYSHLEDFIKRHHTHSSGPGECTAMVLQRIKAPIDVVWSVVRRFDKPQAYKNFVKSCQMMQGYHEGSRMEVGSIREVRVVSGLPASYSRERLEMLDDENHVLSFRILGGEHRLHNYRSTTSLHQMVYDSHCGISSHSGGNHMVSTIVIESYVVTVPEGNTVEDTITFVDTVVRCNLQSLARLSERLAAVCATSQHDNSENNALRSSSASALVK
ncbi:hypothetical protein L7F22_020465 [Adiantum nelumboides]|nr:hypothetical protein [Adiantum nelumboides]